uniref:Uncharacterized protein n=1 Tax=Plectus sambesii TaxID=2011161 RepID=A0A914V6Z4_9BILA
MSCDRVQVWLEQRIRLFFYDLGSWIGDHPKLCIGVTLTCASLLCLGIVNFKEVNDVRQQFSADNSLSRTEYTVAREFFQEQGSPFYLVIGIRAGDGGSLLRNK